jgi:hypothetical protein
MQIISLRRTKSKFSIYNVKMSNLAAYKNEYTSQRLALGGKTAVGAIRMRRFLPAE